MIQAFIFVCFFLTSTLYTGLTGAANNFLTHLKKEPGQCFQSKLKETQAVIFKTRGTYIPLTHKIFYNSENIEVVDSVKVHDVYLTDTLKWTAHMDFVCQKQPYNRYTTLKLVPLTNVS